jgi:CyaY protein
MSEDVLSEREFDDVADKTLRSMVNALAAIEQGFEADLQSGILTIEFEDGAKYIVNSHRAARQIWMAADRTAWHFDYLAQKGRWVASKTGDELWSTVQRVVSRKLGEEVALADPAARG